MRKFCIYISIVFIMISCFAFTVFADTTISPTGFGRSYVDLMNSRSFSILVNGTSLGGDPEPGRHISSDLNAKSVSIRWNLQTSGTYYGYNFCLVTKTKPSSVKIYPYIGSVGLSATYVRNVGNNYYYRYNGTTETDGTYITITADYSSVYSGHFGLNSCFGTYPSSKAIDNTLKYEIACTEVYGNDVSTRVVSSGNQTNLPISGMGLMADPDSSLYLSANFEPYVSTPESLAFIFDTIGSVDPDDVSLGVYTNAGVLKYLVKAEVLSGLGYWYDISDGVGVGPVNVRENVYCVTFDTRGLDLTGYTMKLGVKVKPLKDPVGGEIYPVSINLTNYSVAQPVYVIPWYVKMYTWLESTMNSGFSSIVGAISGSEEDLSESEQLEAEAELKKEEAAQLQQNLVVSKPDVVPPSSNDDIGGMLTGTGVAPIGSVLSVITGNTLVLKILLTVFTLALCAYVFFGKKG